MSNSTPIPAALTDHDRFLIERAEEAIRDGKSLRTWCLNPPADVVPFPLSLGKSYRLSNRAEGYFGSALSNGRTQSIMGCRQEIEFASLDSPRAPELLREFVLGHFLGLSNWKYPGNVPGGFDYSRGIYRRLDGSYGKFDAVESPGCMDWRYLGQTWQWVMLTVKINEFVMEFGPLQKRLKEAALVVAHPEFVQIQDNPSADVRLQVTIGYPFVKFAPIPNFFGYGPGKFETAIKLFTFFLTTDNQVRVRLEFASMPRSQKVFDFGERVPDPVYGGASLLHRLSLGRWKPEPFRDKMDRNMLAQHCRVHQAFMDGAANVWARWLAEAQA